ncbi:hypothetical protein NPIL_267121 [Nephila pilipes]|uniref:Uncharacterized protein n=1 Tax=Nephila pilipes TaxID=299642 RepID=A0A8X6Q3R3_NEPPI|nr:hypothetical protein NPIL_267121 [Nephila pilipes]
MESVDPGPYRDLSGERGRSREVSHKLVLLRRPVDTSYPIARLMMGRVKERVEGLLRGLWSQKLHGASVSVSVLNPRENIE